jgi:CRISPR/Cas system-associated exonuclease Cas4 (RecB family)
VTAALPVPPLALAAALACTAVILLIVTAWLGRHTGVRAGALIVASDVGGAEATVLEDPLTGIRGRPDYLVRERWGRAVYPIEVKPSRVSSTLYDSDAVQLAAYMILIEARYGSDFAGYGLVRYRSTEFRVALTPELRRRCLAAAAGVRVARYAPDVHRSHDVAAKCRACAVRAVCGEDLKRG